MPKIWASSYRLLFFFIMPSLYVLYWLSYVLHVVFCDCTKSLDLIRNTRVQGLEKLNLIEVVLQMFSQNGDNGGRRKSKD